MPAAQGHPTMADVAQRAGVSVSTVSRALRGLSTVSPMARQRVEAAVRELSFVVSRQAASLVTGKTGTVAVVTPALNTWFLGSALTGLSTALRRAGRDLLVYTVTDMAERDAFFNRLPARRNADALLVISFNLTPEESLRLDGHGVPVVYVSQHARDRASVYVDDVAGARRGTRHLLNLGHRRIAYVQTATGAFRFSSPARQIGYEQALTEAGIPVDPELIVRSSLGRRATGEAVGHLLGLPEPPTAVFAEIDQIAMEVIWTLRGSRIAVPEQISVLGFDDHDQAEWMDLTTIAQSAEEIGRVAGELACELIDDPEADRGRHIVLPTRLIPRGSTAPPAPVD
ncbi:LacI family DNA-binding transcriptional regulator [Streptomyces sp. NBC_01803]|uniref:LacI family DNA-binding transcriptional regulator n=1 Tax=Streptomyces sp. NBC_01803 TaxID=2975946 RepID=UPI002DD86D9B|nr:LacI family DNA-binding transcriptional regulator [Streptomyces sp. NBC_01803]